MKNDPDASPLHDWKSCLVHQPLRKSQSCQNSRHFQVNQAFPSSISLYNMNSRRPICFTAKRRDFIL